MKSVGEEDRCWRRDFLNAYREHPELPYLLLPGWIDACRFERVSERVALAMTDELW